MALKEAAYEKGNAFLMISQDYTLFMAFIK
jgi:hypothetical protein